VIGETYALGGQGKEGCVGYSLRSTFLRERERRKRQGDRADGMMSVPPLGGTGGISGGGRKKKKEDCGPEVRDFFLKSRERGKKIEEKERERRNKKLK